MSKVEARVAPERDEKNRQTLTEQVESKIQRAIFDGVYLPGDRLDEEKLAASLSTSRTPIREALRKLSASGMVTIRPRSGATVSRPTMAEVVDLFEVMAELEAFAARLAAERASDAHLNQIVAYHAQCETQAMEGDAEQYFEANQLFHSAIWDGANNFILLEQLQIVDKRLLPYRRHITFHPDRKQSSQSEHRQIAEALAQRSPDAAARAVRDHVMILSGDAMELARNLRL